MLNIPQTYAVMHTITPWFQREKNINAYKAGMQFIAKYMNLINFVSQQKFKTQILANGK